MISRIKEIAAIVMAVVVGSQSFDNTHISEPIELGTHTHASITLSPYTKRSVRETLEPVFAEAPAGRFDLVAVRNLKLTRRDRVRTLRMGLF
jgi:hypothetical protein